MDCRVLSMESEKLELRRCLRGLDMSAMVAARPNIRLRMRVGELLCCAVLFAMSGVFPFEGLIVRSRSMVQFLCTVGGMVMRRMGSWHGLEIE